MSKTFIVVPDCPTSMNLTNEIPVGTYKFEVEQTITANNVIYIANVIYDAGKSITLNPGFEVKNGSVFKAVIDGCGNMVIATDSTKNNKIEIKNIPKGQ